MSEFSSIPAYRLVHEDSLPSVRDLQETIVGEDVMQPYQTEREPHMAMLRRSRRPMNGKRLAEAMAADLPDGASKPLELPVVAVERVGSLNYYAQTGHKLAVILEDPDGLYDKEDEWLRKHAYDDNIRARVGNRGRPHVTLGRVSDPHLLTDDRLERYLNQLPETILFTPLLASHALTERINSIRALRPVSTTPSVVPVTRHDSARKFPQAFLRSISGSPQE